jgi:hypothetical protein
VTQWQTQQEPQDWPGNLNPTWDQSNQTFLFQPITPGPTEQQAQGAAGDKEEQGGQEARGVDPPVNQDTSSVRNSEAVVFTENTGTKSQSTEDLSETDAVKGDQNGSDSESSDSGTNSSDSVADPTGATRLTR